MDVQRIAAIALARTRGVGPITWRHLLARFGTPVAAIEALPELALRGGKRGAEAARRDDIEREIDSVTALGGRYVIVGDPDYPALLDVFSGAPSVMIVKGDTAHFARPAIAMVGARNASAAACRFACMLAGELAAQGYVIVSGLARGIDTAAHQGAIDQGGGDRGGATIGVIASGIDVYFPPQNRALQDQMGDDHLLVTEYPPGTEPLARQVPHRNRIIAGLSLGTVVVEAAPKSGSLLTARMAGERGRDVMAVPGSPLDPRAQGCNLLIREGATLVQSADDILECIGAGQIIPRVYAPPPPSLTPSPVPRSYVEAGDAERERVRGLLGPVAVSVDELARQADLPVELVQSILLEFELAGRISYHAGGRVSWA